MLVESSRGGRPAGEPPASEVVRARLLELIRDLQRPDASAGDPPAVRYAAGPRADDRADHGPPEDDADPEDWLDRLRRPIEPDAGPEPERDPTPGSPWMSRAAGRMLVFGREHLAAVVVVLLVGVAWSAYSLLQARSSPVAAAAPVIQSSAPATVAATPAAAQVVVHVIGAVRRPGIVKLPDGSRVADAITAAGGLSDSAAPGELNLAQVLADGVQLKIGSKQHPGGWIRGAADASGTSSSGGAAGGDSAKVALNSATLEQLDTLPGIGPVTAQKILDRRKAHGKFTAITELEEVDGIGPKTYADLADHVRL